MKRVLLLNLVFMVGVLLALSWHLEAAPQWKGEIKIGYTGSFAGASNFYGVAERDGAQIACEEINKAGGVLGRKLVFFCRDSEGSPEKSVSQAKELCLKYSIDFALGPNRSSDARAASAVFQRYKIPTLILCSMAEEVMEMGNPYYVRVCNPNSVCGKAMASAVKKGNYKRPSVIYLNDFWGMDLRKTLHKEMEALGLKIVSEENFDMGAPDISPQAMKILAANPDIILLVAYSGDASTCVRTFKSLGYKGDYIGYSGLFFNPVREAGGHDVDGIVFPAGYHCQGFYVWNRPGAIPLLLKLETLNPYGKYPLLNASPEIAVLDGYQAIYTFKKWIELAGERGLKDKDYFMDVVAKSKVHSVAMDVSFPQGRTKMEAVTLDDLYMMQYVNGHMRVWKYDPRCIETFETTRIQAEEEVYSKGFTKGVTFKKYLGRWQELLRENKSKVDGEINSKLEKGIITREYADMFKKVVEEIVTYKF
jgi:branched-chain amino acid transport system substrate-binding protein